MFCLIEFSVFQRVCNSWAAYCVIAVTDHENDPSKPNFERSTSASSYCYPRTRIYISSDGIEDPSCDAILIILQMDKRCDAYYDVRFRYDDGIYVGVLDLLTGARRRFYAEACHKIGNADGVIFDVSSL